MFRVGACFAHSYLANEETANTQFVNDGVHAFSECLGRGSESAHVFVNVFCVFLKDGPKHQLKVDKGSSRIGGQ